MGDASRLPPFNIDAERSVLGSMLRDNYAIDDVVQHVCASNFYTDAHQKIFTSIVTMYEKGEAVDLVILANYLKDEKLIDDTGGYPYLAELWDAAPTAANAEYYAKIVKDKSLMRSLIHTSNEISRDAYEAAAPGDEQLDMAEKKILDIAQKSMTGDGVTLQQAIEQAQNNIADRRAKKGSFVGAVATGYADLDVKTAGLHNNELILIAARPSVGKTSFGLNLILNVVATDDQAGFFVSLEQSRAEIAERLLCCQAKVDTHKVRRGYIGDDEHKKLMHAGSELRKMKMFIDDTPQQTMLRIGANARRLRRREKINIVVIDYLQLIEPDDRRAPRHEQVGVISRRLKFLARELEIPVVALAQVNRQSEDRADHKPRLADLRESGNLEQDADTVIMLHRPDPADGSVVNHVEVIIAKQRNGPVGEVTLSFRKEYMRFENWGGPEDIPYGR